VRTRGITMSSSFGDVLEVEVRVKVACLGAIASETLGVIVSGASLPLMMS